MSRSAQGDAPGTLFVAGPGRSGTTAFADYMNRHPEVMVCRERYKFVPREISPRMFSPERILDQREGETNTPASYHEKLLSGKEPERLKWVGDKVPDYVKHLPALYENNPGARFVVMHRPAEEVAESYDARSRNPEDPWLWGKNGFEIGVRDWNTSVRQTRRFAEEHPEAEVLIVGYHGFFSGSEDYIPLLSRFLGIEFDEAVRASWARTSRWFEKQRRHKEPLTGEQARYVRENKDHAAEEWVLERIRRQWAGKKPRPLGLIRRLRRLGSRLPRG